MLQLLQSLNIKLSKDSGSKPLRLLASIEDTLVSTSDFNEAITLCYNVATATVDEQVNLGSVTDAKMLYIKADQAIEIKLNDVDGTNREITLKADKASLLHADFSALYISNSTGSEANIEIIVAGD